MVSGGSDIEKLEQEIADFSWNFKRRHAFSPMI
jgi:hypothetical protein